MSRGSAPTRRATVYCVVPADLAGQLHELLRRHFADDSQVEVVVEQRGRERRNRDDRRHAPGPAELERRHVRAAAGRRVGDRRAPVLALAPPETLPRRARTHAGRLRWVERVAPAEQWAEDVDTARLVTRIQSGEASVFGEIYLRYFDRVYAYLRVVLNDPHEAEDATQQAFLRVMEAIPRYERRRQPFRAWLFTVVRNESLNRLRERRRPMSFVDPAALTAETEAEVSADDLAALAWISDRELVLLLERLPLPQRQAVFLRFALDLGASQVAEIMERSPDDVRMLQHRALTFLRQRLVALGRGPEAPRHIRSRSRLREATVLRARRFAISR